MSNARPVAPKGSYSQLTPNDVDRSGDANVFAPKPPTLGSWFQMGVLLLVGVASMLVHHFFYSYLDGTPVVPLPFTTREISIVTSNQSVASVVGNAIAYLARAVLSAAIGMAFIQVLWLELRSGQFSVKLIDALVACENHPFTMSALLVWRYAFLLAVIASASSLMALISIIAPGSLLVVPSESSSQCTVPAVSLNTSNIALNTFAPNGSFSFMGTQPPIIKLAGRVLMAGAPLSPHNPCPGPCRYQISFDAPIVNCGDVNSDFDIAEWIPLPIDSTSLVPVWNAGAVNAGSCFVAALRNPANNSEAAVNCTSYKATYTVEITHSNTTSTTRVLHTDQHGLTYTANSSAQVGKVETQYDSVTIAFARILLGTVVVEPSTGSIFSGDNWLVGMSPSFSGSAKSSWSPPSDLRTEISTFMQNLSISLLADQLMDEGDAPTAPVNTTCYYPIQAFAYQQTRLFAVYGTALGITLICVLIGARAMHLNGVEESFTFSRIVGAVLNKSLFESRDVLTKSSTLTTVGSPDGQLRLMRTSVSDSD